MNSIFFYSIFSNIKYIFLNDFKFIFELCYGMLIYVEFWDIFSWDLKEKKSCMWLDLDCGCCKMVIFFDFKNFLLVYMYVIEYYYEFYEFISVVVNEFLV